MSPILIALLAAVGYGAWAAYANHEYGLETAVMAGTVQAVYAFLSTLSVTHVARWIFFRFGCAIKGIAAGFLASFVVMLLFPLVVHRLAGTPDLWQTILPGLIWGSVYLLGYLVAVDRRERQSQRAQPSS
ncbi:MAG: hypothetical protein AAGJ52_02185 [Pseudomonadota bacterium]